MTKAFMLFHLNLAYSSIAESCRKQVIESCYYPLLHLIKDTKIPIGIEVTGWTLKQIQLLAPQWISEFKSLLQAGQTELIGSGYVQLIGPLVPYEVNVWNQKLGLQDYENILGVKPRLALVNEMAFSTGLVEVYTQAGYEGIIMDRDNVRLALNLEDDNYDAVPTHARGLNNTSIPVLWSDSILFQKLQRYTHGDSRLEDYLNFFKRRASMSKRPLAVYCNDAEIFDYRPGRFREERPAHEEGEWLRLERLLNLLSQQEGVDWLLPSRALQESLVVMPRSERILSSITQPIPVKKQAKYNVSRWAISGRNDLWMNTLCHRLAKHLHGCLNLTTWQRLCELWASDLRTHIEIQRWEQACSLLEKFLSDEHLSCHYGVKNLDDVDVHYSSMVDEYDPFRIEYDPEGILLSIETSFVRLVLNLRRGLTIHSLAFASQEFKPLVGTLPHGYFDSIEYGADFYSVGVIVELPTEHRRITDLERVQPRFALLDGQLHIQVSIHVDKGIINKCYIVPSAQEWISFSINFPQWERQHAIVRAGMLTLLPETYATPLSLEVCNGGSAHEVFDLNQVCDHTRSASSLVSCTTGFGATTGEIILGDLTHKLKVNWDPTVCALFPMLIHQVFRDKALTRLFLSLGELDETIKAGGVLPSLQITLSPQIV